MTKPEHPVVIVDTDIAVDPGCLPEALAFEAWAAAAILQGAPERRSASIAIRVVDEVEGRRLNHDFRGRDTATNVLSFPFEELPGIEEQHIGDLAICASIVEREASEQGKTPLAHWAHMTVHGVLHLLGYDHENEHDAAQMESCERNILSTFGFADPYQIQSGT